MENDLIYDIGMHTGRDTEFYLKKGFRVISVEASPDLVKLGNEKFRDFLKSGQLVIVPRAIFETSGVEIDFYVNPEKDDWGSTIQAAAEKGMRNAIRVPVITCTLMDLVQQYGLPYYLKCDIEGGDTTVLQQLGQLVNLPRFVSLEINGADYFEKLCEYGFEMAQLVNQNLNWIVKPPHPAREGRYVDATFDGHCSGLFGRELEPSKWRPIMELKEHYEAWDNVRNMDPALIGHAWLDVHAKLAGS